MEGGREGAWIRVCVYMRDCGWVWVCSTRVSEAGRSLRLWPSMFVPPCLLGCCLWRRLSYQRAPCGSWCGGPAMRPCRAPVPKHGCPPGQCMHGSSTSPCAVSTHDTGAARRLCCAHTRHGNSTWPCAVGTHDTPAVRFKQTNSHRRKSLTQWVEAFAAAGSPDQGIPGLSQTPDSQVCG